MGYAGLGGAAGSSKLFPYEMVNKASKSPVLKDSESEDDEEEDDFADYRKNEASDPQKLFAKPEEPDNRLFNAARETVNPATASPATA